MSALAGSGVRQILVAAALRDQVGHDAAVAHLRAKVKPGVEVVPGLADPPDGIDWAAVRAAEGGWNGAYEWAARSHAAVCVVPVDGDCGLSRGVYAMADAALRAGKPVLLFAAGELLQVGFVRVANPDEYRGVYGVAALRRGTSAVDGGPGEVKIKLDTDRDPEYND